MLIFPYIYRNHLFWPAYGEYSGSCYNSEELPKSAFTVGNFWAIFIPILPLSVVLSVIGIWLLKLEKQKFNLKKYFLSIRYILIILSKLIISLLVVTGSVIFLVVQKQTWDKYTVITLDGKNPNEFSCGYCYFKDYKGNIYFHESYQFSSPYSANSSGTFLIKNDIIKTYLEGGDTTIIYTADEESFEVLHFNMAYDFYPGNSIYAKDKNNMYCMGEVLESVDPDSVKSYGGSFWGDNTSVYFECNKLNGIDTSTTEYVSDYWIKDSSNLYYEYVPLDFNVNSIEILSESQIKVSDKWIYNVRIIEDGKINLRLVQDESYFK